MRSHRKIILALFLLIATGILVTGFHDGMPAQEIAAVTTNEVPTPVVPGVMTDRQRRHSKLYEKYASGRRKLRDVTHSVRLVIPTPFIESPDDKRAQSIDQFFQLAACNADLIVIGVIKNKTSQLTENGSFVFTDYEMVIDHLLKNTASTGGPLNSSLVITRPGGAIEINGNIVMVKLIV